MKKSVKQKAKFTALTAVTVLMLSLVPAEVKAAGGYTVSTTSVTVEVGSTGTITVSANNAAGRVDISSEGAVTASDYFWLDSSSQSFSFKADYAGVGYIYVTPTDIATYDAEEITNSYTITVTVTEAAAATTAAPETTTAASETTTAPTETTTDSWILTEGDVLTDGDTDYEDLEKDERLYTYIDGKEYFIIQNPFWHDGADGFVWTEDITGLELISGTEPETVNYKQVEVNCFSYYDSLYIYVLRDVEEEKYVYCTLEDGSGFSLLAYVIDNDQFYIAADFPDGFVIPGGYTETELFLNGTGVRALKQILNEPVTFDESSDNTQETGDDGSGAGAAEKNAGYIAEAYQGADFEDVTDDIYYIFCMADGETLLCSYDAKEGTVQRASLLSFSSTSEDDTSKGDETNEDGWSDTDTRTKVLVIALAVAVAMLIVLIITNINLRRRYTKLRCHSTAARDKKESEKAQKKDAAPDENEKAAETGPAGDAGSEDAEAAERIETSLEAEETEESLEAEAANEAEEIEASLEAEIASEAEEAEKAAEIMNDAEEIEASLEAEITDEAGEAGKSVKKTDGAGQKNESSAESKDIQVISIEDEISGLLKDDDPLK